MSKITLTPWQSAAFHGLITFIGSAVAMYLAGHPDLANMTVAGVFAAVWNYVQGRSTTEASA